MADEKKMVNEEKVVDEKVVDNPWKNSPWKKVVDVKKVVDECLFEGNKVLEGSTDKYEASTSIVETDDAKKPEYDPSSSFLSVPPSALEAEASQSASGDKGSGGDNNTGGDADVNTDADTDGAAPPAINDQNEDSPVNEKTTEETPEPKAVSAPRTPWPMSMYVMSTIHPAST